MEPSPNRQAIVHYLQTNRLCEGLPFPILEALANSITVLEMEKDAVLFEDEDLTHSVHLVASGEIGFLIRMTPSSGFTEIARVGKNEFFGEGAAIDDLAAQEQSPGANGFIRRSARSARIICREKALLLRLPATEFERLLREHPLLLCRNLLRSSSDKLRMGVQRTFDEALARESRHLLAHISHWLARRMENPVSTLRLQSGLLAEQDAARSAAPIAAATDDLAATLHSVARLAGTARQRLTWETFAVRDWWNETESGVLDQLEPRGIALDSYLEDFTVESSRPLLRDAMLDLLAGVARLNPGEGRIGLRAGRHHGHAEIHVHAILPGFNDVVARRLFEPFSGEGIDHEAAVRFALARQTARRLGGDTTVKRRDGERVTFALTLPTRRPDASV